MIMHKQFPKEIYWKTTTRLTINKNSKRWMLHQIRGWSDILLTFFTNSICREANGWEGNPPMWIQDQLKANQLLNHYMKVGHLPRRRQKKKSPGCWLVWVNEKWSIHNFRLPACKIFQLHRIYLKILHCGTHIFWE